MNEWVSGDTCYEKKEHGVKGAVSEYLWGRTRANCYFVKGAQGLARGFKNILALAG